MFLGCVIVSTNAQEILSKKKIRLNSEIPIVNLNGESILNIPLDQLKFSFEKFLSNDELIPNKNQKSIYLRILLCFMCGGDKNDVETFFSQLSSRFSLIVTNQSTFLINTFINRSNRKVRRISFVYEYYFLLLFRLN